MKKIYLLSILFLLGLGCTVYAQGKELLTGNEQAYNSFFSVLPVNTVSSTYDTAYCYIAYDQQNNRSGPAKFALSDPGNLILLADQAVANYVSAGTWGFKNIWYGITSNENTLITIDPLSGVRKAIGTTGHALSGISYNYTNGTLYGVGWDGFASLLYTLNTTNGSATLIGPCGTDILVNLACDALGNLFSVGLTHDKLYQINKSTGTYVEIGPIGIDANYEQDMEFDLNTGILYMAAYSSNTSSGELRTVDKITGATTLIAKFEGGAEITGLGIPNDAVNVNNQKLLKAENSVKIFPNPGTGIFTFESDAITSAFEVTNAIGKRIYSAQIDSQKAEIDLSKQPKGIYFYQVKNGNKILNTGKIIIE